MACEIANFLPFVFRKLKHLFFFFFRYNYWWITEHKYNIPRYMQQPFLVHYFPYHITAVQWERESERETTHGWRKCSKSQALRMATDRSGRPRWGLHTCCRGSRNPKLLPHGLFFWKLCSTNLNLAVVASPPLLLLAPVVGEEESSPKATLTFLSWSAMAFLRQRKCLNTVFKATETYGVAELRPATVSKEETTICICWWYCLYLLET